MSQPLAAATPISSSEVNPKLQEQHASSDADFGPDFKIKSDDERKCTDPIFSVLFFLFWIGMLVVGATAFTKANAIGGADRHIRGYQMDGKICGQDGEFGAGLDYKYSMKILTNGLSIKSLCVTDCPKKVGDDVVGYVEEVGSNEKVKVTTKALYSVEANPKYSSYCTPTFNLTAAKASAAAATSGSSVVDTEAAAEAFQEALYDVNDAMGAIWGSLGFAILFSFIFLLFVKYFAGITIFIAICTGLTALAVVGYFFYFLSTCTLDNKTTFDRCGSFTDHEKTAYTFGAVVAWGLFFILLCVVFFMRDRILLAIKLMRQAVNAINDMKMMLATPIMMLLPLIVVLVWWLTVCVAMASAGTLSITDNVTMTDFATTTTIDVPVRTVVWDQTMWYGFVFFHPFVCSLEFRESANVFCMEYTPRY